MITLPFKSPLEVKLRGTAALVKVAGSGLRHSLSFFAINAHPPARWLCQEKEGHHDWGFPSRTDSTPKTQPDEGLE